MATESNIVKFGSTQIDANAFTSDPHGAVDKMTKALADVKDVDSAITALKSSEFIGRAAWIHTAIIVHNVFKDVKRSEAKELTAKMCKALGLAQAHVYNYRKAGEKLASGEWDEIPLSLMEFIHREKVKSMIDEIQPIDKIGEYELNDVIYQIFTATRKVNDKSEKCFISTNGDIKCESVIESGTTGIVWSKIKVSHLTKKETGKPYDVYHLDDSKTFEVKFLNL